MQVFILNEELSLGEIICFKAKVLLILYNSSERFQNESSERFNFSIIYNHKQLSKIFI